MKKITKFLLSVIITFSLLSVFNLNIKTTAFNNKITIKNLNEENTIEEIFTSINEKQDGRYIKN
ncbi:MAG: hypothetical protein QHH15_01870 [Candidatus Thermoplasmatota archaeon]|jgi:p-aminobenzoyl-glutamate transporter AbgT|nr:hypothetical protein [Candidatus Thermoplasmatota archaeon]